MKKSDLEPLITACEEIAQSSYDGHLTIYRFTTGWKVILGTPEMSIPEDYELCRQVRGRMTLTQVMSGVGEAPG